MSAGTDSSRVIRSRLVVQELGLSHPGRSVWWTARTVRASKSACCSAASSKNIVSCGPLTVVVSTRGTVRVCPPLPRKSPLLPPVAHLPFDDAGVDPVPTLLQHFLRDLRYHVAIPLPQTPATRRTRGQATPQDLQRPGEREPLRVDPVHRRSLPHQHPDHVVAQQQAVQLLHHPTGRLAP